MIGDTTTAELVERLNQPRHRNAKTIPRLEGKDAELMTGVFARMKSIYGHLWSSNFTDADQLAIAKLDWHRALHRGQFSLGEVNEALDWCATKVPDMPNLPRFIDIARQARQRLQRRKELAAGYLALPESPEQAAVRKAEDAREREHFRRIAEEGLKTIKNIL